MVNHFDPSHRRQAERERNNAEWPYHLEWRTIEGHRVQVKVYDTPPRAEGPTPARRTMVLKWQTTRNSGHR